MWATYIILKFLVATLEKFKGNGKFNCYNIFYLTHISKIFQHGTNIRITNEIYIPFYAKFLKSGINFILTVHPICMLNIQ